MYSKAQKQATRKWNEKNYDRIYLAVPKGMKQQIEAVAKSQGLSIRAYIINTLEKEMGETK